jgi:signal transduction histidine kinase/HPt (histidine-containing phosphotransfer) domain-containing protein/ActR/RegA family two-component response regulator
MLISSLFALVVEPDDNAFYRLTDLLRAHRSDVLVRRVASIAESEKVFSETDAFDVALIDLDDPTTQSLEKLVQFVKRADRVPVVGFGHETHEALALAAMNEGMQDFFTKWELNRRALSLHLVRATYRKRLIDQLNQSREAAILASRVKSRFLAQMSHEIRTPLVSMVGFAQLLAEERLSPKDSRDGLLSLQRNSQYLIGLLDNVLASAQIEREEFVIRKAPVEISELVRSVSSMIQLQADTKGIAFRTEVDSKVPNWISSDPTRLLQALMNLVTNAIKYTDEGSVLLKVQSFGGSSLNFSVEDTGRGIAPESRDRIFSAFTQGSSSPHGVGDGVGLGLFVAQRVATSLGGALSFESTVGKGSAFHLIVPLEVVAAPPKDRLVAHSPRLAGNVLIVEDVADCAKYIQVLLSDTGAKVSWSPDAIDAIGRIDRGEPFELVLMDIGLPGLDGISAIKRLRSQGFKQPIIALSAHAFDEEISNCLAAGADKYITKPFRPDEFLGLLGSYIGSREEVIQPSVQTNGHKPDGSLKLSASERLRQIRERFLADLPARFASIEQAQLQGRWDVVSEGVHKLAGSAGLLGYERLSDIARDTEVHIRSGALEGVPLDIKQLSQEVAILFQGQPVIKSVIIPDTTH